MPVYVYRPGMRVKQSQSEQSSHSSWVARIKSKQPKTTMKTSRFYSIPCCRLLVLMAGMALASSAGAQSLVTNWVAFNDHNLSGLPAPMTGPNVSLYNLGVGPGGPLQDQVTGAELIVGLSVTAEGGDGPDAFGASTDANPGTPADMLFNGFVDIGGVVVVGTPDSDEGIIGLRVVDGAPGTNVVTLTFTNLDPSKKYFFRGTSVRGNNYADRWASYRIDGAASFVDAHVDVSTNNNLFTMADAPEGLVLPPGQVVINSGENREGSLVGWDEIDPGPDGNFSIAQFHWVGLGTFGNPSAGPYGYGMNAIMLLEVGPPEPASIVVNPVSPPGDIIENRAFTLRVLARGGPLPTYQWYKDGAPIPDATRQNYAVTNAVLADTGDYHVVVSNPSGSVESTVASVTVIPDTEPPVVVSVAGTPGGGNVFVEFDELVDPLTAGDAFNYAVNGINALSAVLTNEFTVFLMLESPIPPCAAGELVVSGVQDLFAHSLASTTVVFAVDQLLLAPGDSVSWRYDQEGVDRGSTWAGPGYDDSAWTTGLQLFDFSTTARAMLPNGVLVTTPLVLTNGNWQTSNIPTYYFRTHFDLPTHPATVTRLRARLLVDDGVVLHLNGAEVYRLNIDAGAPFDAYANLTVGTADYVEVDLPPSALREGDNVLAAEVKNASAASSDITFGLELLASVSGCASGLQISLSEGQVTLTWSAEGAVLEQASSLLGPWAEVAGATSGYSAAASDAAQYFRLRLP